MVGNDSFWEMDKFPKPDEEFLNAYFDNRTLHSDRFRKKNKHRLPPTPRESPTRSVEMTGHKSYNTNMGEKFANAEKRGDVINVDEEPDAAAAAAPPYSKGTPSSPLSRYKTNVHIEVKKTI